MPLVSVIIPVYNVEKYLNQCLDSVIAQTLTDIEIICVNDSSTDGSLGILEEYEKKDKRDPGCDSAQQRSRSCTKQRVVDGFGESIFLFLTRMIFLSRTCLNLLIRKQKKTARILLSSIPISTTQIRGKFVEVSWTLREKEIPPYTPFSHRQMTDNIFKVFVGWAWDKLYNKEFVEKNHLLFQEQRTSNDMLFVFSAVALAKRISIVNKVLAHQRRDATDSLSKTRENSWHCFYDALTALRERLKAEGLFKEMEKDYINYALHFSLWNINTLAEPRSARL